MSPTKIHGDDPEDRVSDSEYYSFDYQYHQHLTHWKARDLVVPLVGFSIVILLLLLFLPYVGVAILVLMVFLAFLFCFGPTNRRLRVLAKARQARQEIKDQPGLPLAVANQGEGKLDDIEQSPPRVTRIQRDWSKANGWYRSKTHPETGRVALEFTPFSSVFLQTDNPVWNIRGKAEDSSFHIMHGLIAENGQLYWLENHQTESGWPSSVSDGCQPALLRKTVLVRGCLDYETLDFNGFWADSMDCKGTYEPLGRHEDLDISTMPVEFVEIGCIPVGESP